MEVHSSSVIAGVLCLKSGRGRGATTSLIDTYLISLCPAVDKQVHLCRPFHWQPPSYHIVKTSRSLRCSCSPSHVFITISVSWSILDIDPPLSGRRQFRSLGEVFYCPWDKDTGCWYFWTHSRKGVKVDDYESGHSISWALILVNSFRRLFAH